MFFAFENQITKPTSQTTGLVIDMVLCKTTSYKATSLLNGLVNAGDVAEGLTTYGQWPWRQGVQMVHTLKIALILQS
jgi:hypothetical protein